MRFFLLLSLGLLLASCVMPLSSDGGVDFSVNVPAQVHDASEVNSWVRAHTTYKHDDTGDYWQTPEETLALGTGDCEDFSILSAALYKAFGVEVSFVLTHIPDRPPATHCILRIAGKLQDPQGSIEPDRVWPVDAEWSFEDFRTQAQYKR